MKRCASAADPREERLAKWARDLIDDLRRKVEDAEREAEEARLATRPDETDTVIQPYDDIPIGLPKGERVRFRLGPPGDLRHYLEVRVADDFTVEVMAGASLRVYPRASNVILLQVGE